MDTKTGKPKLKETLVSLTTAIAIIAGVVVLILFLPHSKSGLQDINDIPASNSVLSRRTLFNNTRPVAHLNLEQTA